MHTYMWWHLISSDIHQGGFPAVSSSLIKARNWVSLRPLLHILLPIISLGCLDGRSWLCDSLAAVSHLTAGSVFFHSQAVNLLHTFPWCLWDSVFSSSRFWCCQVTCRERFFLFGKRTVKPLIKNHKELLWFDSRKAVGAEKQENRWFDPQSFYMEFVCVRGYCSFFWGGGFSPKNASLGLVLCSL